MAYLSKEQYDRRRENAAQRAVENEEIAVKNGMTQKQAELISELCRVRHEFHSNMESIAKFDERGIKYKLLLSNVLIYESGLEPISSIPTDRSDYIDIDDIYLLRELGEYPEGEEEQKEWYEENFSRICDELESLNKQIESYLESIDEKYGTHFAPTGALRIF